jgi:hypothetical protein
MTADQQANVKRDVLYAAQEAAEEVTAYRLRLSVMGQHLGNLSRALEEHPENVTRIPDPHSLYDYTEGIKILRNPESVLKMCEDLRYAIDKARAAEMRTAVFKKPSAFHDSVV